MCRIYWTMLVCVTTWLCRTTSRRRKQLTPKQDWRTLRNCSKFHSQNVQLQKCMDTSSTTEMAKIIGKHWRSSGTSGTNIFWSSVIGETVRRSFIRTSTVKKHPNGNAFLAHRKQGLFLSVHVDDIDWIWKEGEYGWNLEEVDEKTLILTNRLREKRSLVLRFGRTCSEMRWATLWTW